MDYKIVKKANQKERYWAGGISKELYIFPDGSTINDPFNFRVSTATINPGEYKFSDFKGYKRLAVLLSGNVKLDIDGRDYFLEPYSHIFFSGDSHVNTSCDVECIDFNLIYKDNIELLDFQIIDYQFYGEPLSNKAINIYYNIDKVKHLTVNKNEYILEPGDTLIACGNNFHIEGDGKGILLSLGINW